MKRYCGRDFSEAELTLIRTLIAEDPRRTRADLSRLACQAMHWLRPDGGLQDMSCRIAMLRMQRRTVSFNCRRRLAVRSARPLHRLDS